MTDTRHKLELKDDPARDYRQRWVIPEHFSWDPDDLPMIDYLGYLSVSFALLPPAPCSVLDVGCGDGWVARDLLSQGYQVTGIDYSERAVAYARILAEGGEFHHCDIRLLGEREVWHETFDAAVCIEVLEHIPPEYYTGVLADIYRTLRSKGTLIITVPSVYLRLNPWHYKHFTLEEITELVTSAGLRVDDVVHQHVTSFLFSPRFWRLLRNKVFDARLVRRVLKPILLKRFNVTTNANNAGRYIVKAVKP